MTPNKFEKSLSHIRKQRLPDCPTNLEQNVLRKIRLREDETTTSNGIFHWLYMHLFDLGWATPAMAGAVLLVSIASTAAIASTPSDSLDAANALGFDSIVDSDQLALFTAVSE